LNKIALVPAVFAGTRRKEKPMIGPIITYELAKTIHDDRLNKATQARLINSFKTASSPVKFKKRGWRIAIKGVLSKVVDKKMHLRTYKGHLIAQDK
jgi:hypothetical protein